MDATGQQVSAPAFIAAPASGHDNVHTPPTGWLVLAGDRRAALKRGVRAWASLTGQRSWRASWRRRLWGTVDAVHHVCWPWTLREVGWLTMALAAALPSFTGNLSGRAVVAGGGGSWSPGSAWAPGRGPLLCAWWSPLVCRKLRHRQWRWPR